MAEAEKENLERDFSNENRNSYAPNEGYQYFDASLQYSMERRRSSLRRNSSLVSDDDFKNQAYGMLRKQKNPKPNWSDHMLHSVYRLTKIYIPVSSILALMDFVLDWRNAVQLMSSDKCSTQAFGAMMFSTVLIIPMVFAIIHKSTEEYEMWEYFFRWCTGAPLPDPFGDVDEDDAPITVQYMAWGMYVLFSPFTHLVTQMSLHNNSAEKVEFYLEFDVRKAKVMKQLHLGCFTSYDGDELDRLKELQFRATHYVQYYVKYAKDRLRYCLVEDTLQFNIQFAMFLFAMYTAPQEHPGTFDYLDEATFLGVSVRPDTKLAIDAFMYILGLVTSLIMLWQGFFQIERYHEQLTVRNHIGLLRVGALCLKAIIELILPSISLLILMISFPLVDKKDSEIKLTECAVSDWMGNMVKFYLVFIIFLSLGINFMWSFFLNYCNRGTGDDWQAILKETSRMSIYTACITVKYNRIASHEESVIEAEYVAGTKAKLQLFAACFLRFLPAFIVVLGLMPTQYAKTERFSYVVTSSPTYLSYMNRVVNKNNDKDQIIQLSPPFMDYRYPMEHSTDKNLDWWDTNNDETYGITANKDLACVTGNSICYQHFYTKYQTPDNEADKDYGNNEDDDDIDGVVLMFEITPKQISDAGIAVGIDTADFKSDQWWHVLKAIRNAPDDEENLKQKLEAKVMMETHEKVSSFTENRKSYAKIVSRRNNWYDGIVKHKVIDDDVAYENLPTPSQDEFNRYMGKIFWETTTNGGQKFKLFFVVLVMYVVFCVSCIMSEPKCKTSNYLRTNNLLVRILYPIILPIIMGLISFNIEKSAVDNQTKPFCKLYPERIGDSWLVRNFFGDTNFDCINGESFKSIQRCTYGAVCFYDQNDYTTENLSEFGKRPLTRSPTFNNPKQVYEKYIEGTDERKDLGIINLELSSDFSKFLETEPFFRNTMCYVYDGLQSSQFGDVIYDSRTRRGAGNVKLDELDKCQLVLGEVSKMNSDMKNFFAAAYKEGSYGDMQKDINEMKGSFWGETAEELLDDDNWDKEKLEQHAQSVYDHFEDELECFDLKGYYTVYQVITETTHPKLDYTDHPLWKEDDFDPDKGGTYNPEESLEQMMVPMTCRNQNRYCNNGNEDKFNSGHFAEYSFFEEQLDGACATGFRLTGSGEEYETKFFNRDAAKYLKEEAVNDLRKSYFVNSDDNNVIFVNWPEQITMHPKTHGIKPVIAEIKEDQYILGKLKSKTPNTQEDSDPDSVHNSPLFNPYYHYAVDLYGSNTLKDLHAIPFEKMGRALDEIHENAGPWVIPYEPPNIGPASTSAIPTYRVKGNGNSRLLGKLFEVDIIDLPRELRVDTTGTLWHYYIHSIMFPFTAPLPWWSETEDPDKATIQSHEFTENDSFFDGGFDTKTLHRQINPDLSFLYAIEQNENNEKFNKSDVYDSNKSELIRNSYFQVPVWSREPLPSGDGTYGDLQSDGFKEWKEQQMEYQDLQDSTDPWVESDAEDTDIDLSTGCTLSFKDKTKIFGIGPKNSDVDMTQDSFSWATKGLGNRNRFRIDEDYVVYGPGGQGLKRTLINPLAMQYEFDDKLRNALLNATYKGQSAKANYEDGMGWAIDDALDEEGINKDSNFSVPMTHYLFTNLMSRMWPKDYDERFILPYTYYFEHGGTIGSDKGEDVPFTTPCKDGYYTFLNPDGTEKTNEDGDPLKMWCIGGPMAFDPNTRASTETVQHLQDLRNVTLKDTYKPEADFIRNFTDFFPFMDLGDPFVNQEFTKKHKFGLLHKFWDTPSRVKIYSTDKPYSNYKKRYEILEKEQHNQPWYKPYMDLDVHHTHNLNHVNTYVGHIDSTTRTLKVEDYWRKFDNTSYHDLIKNHIESEEYNGMEVLQRPSEPEGNMVTLVRDRLLYGLQPWQRIFTKKNKKSLNPGWHFFGREWDYDHFEFSQRPYESDPNYNEGNDYMAEALDIDYSLYNVLPNSPTFVRTTTVTDREAECMISQPEIDTMSYGAPVGKPPGAGAGYCNPNYHYISSNPDLLKDIAEIVEEVTPFNPGKMKYDEKKSYTQFNHGDLHISKTCIKHKVEEKSKGFIFAQVRRLKPFYYFYCDKWINNMETERVNLATDGGKISTRPCSKKILDPLNRFQPWDTHPQTAFADRDVSKIDTALNEEMTRPFILAEPEVVSPYSLMFEYDPDLETFDHVSVIPDGLTVDRGSCISSLFYPPADEENPEDGGALICFGGIAKGKPTNIALSYYNKEWRSGNNKEDYHKRDHFVSEMNMPIPLLDHTAMEIDGKIYLMGGRSLLNNFRRTFTPEIVKRGINFMKYGYRKDLPKDAIHDNEFVEKNTPLKSFHKVSGEQMYPPIFGTPEEYGIAGQYEPTSPIGRSAEDYGPNGHVFVFTGLSSQGKSGWEQSLVPVHARKWPIVSTFYKRQYAYIFTPGNDEGIVHRFNVHREALHVDAARWDEEKTNDAKTSRKRRSLEYVKELQGGKYSPNTGPFMNNIEDKMIYSKDAHSQYLPTDWTTVMDEFFMNDYGPGQMCRMCDATSHTISFQKLRTEAASPFKHLDSPSEDDQTLLRDSITFVHEVLHADLITTGTETTTDDTVDETIDDTLATTVATTTVATTTVATTTVEANATASNSTD